MLTRPTANGPPPDPKPITGFHVEPLTADELATARRRLSDARNAHCEEEQRLEALTHGRERAQRELYEARNALTTAEQALRDARTTSPGDTAWSYVAGDHLIDRQVLAEAKAGLDLATARYEQLREIVDALDGEIRNCESRLRLRRGVLNERFAQLVCGSPEFCSLLAELGAAYGKVRGLLKAMGTIQHALAGSMPGVLSSVWQQAVPLNPEIIDYPTDDGPSDTSLISC